MLLRVALVRNRRFGVTQRLHLDDKQFLRSVRRLLVTSSVVPSSPILATLMKEALSSSETPVPTRVTRRNIAEEAILHSHRRENLKSYNIIFPSYAVQECHRVKPNFTRTVTWNTEMLNMCQRCYVNGCWRLLQVDWEKTPFVRLVPAWVHIRDLSFHSKHIHCHEAAVVTLVTHCLHKYIQSEPSFMFDRVSVTLWATLPVIFFACCQKMWRLEYTRL
jgi:hypothetical protein